MKIRATFILLASAISFFTLGGCSLVTSAQGGSNETTGEAWYVRTGIFGGAKVYYCPAGEYVCYKANLRTSQRSLSPQNSAPDSSGSRSLE